MSGAENLPNCSGFRVRLILFPGPLSGTIMLNGQLMSPGISCSMCTLDRAARVQAAPLHRPSSPGMRTDRGRDPDTWRPGLPEGDTLCLATCFDFRCWHESSGNMTTLTALHGAVIPSAALSFTVNGSRRPLVALIKFHSCFRWRAKKQQSV